MHQLELTPLATPVTATIEIPGSKSYTNRALVMAAMSKKPTVLYNPLYSDDTHAMISCLRTLGLHIETANDQLIVHDSISDVPSGHYELFAHDSGTTMRFLLPLLCHIPGIKKLKGTERLNARPIRDLVEALKQLGATINSLGEIGQAPLEILSSTLHGTTIQLNASSSSQFLSALLMTAPLANGLKIHLKDEPISKPYIEMTISVMRESGIDVLQHSTCEYEIPAGQSYQKDHHQIEGDFSSAGYFFAIAVLTQSTITLTNLNPHSKQADRHFVTILEKMGNQIVKGSDRITITGKNLLPIAVDMEDCPDQVQTMAVLAAFANGVTTISGIRSLRVKETDRVYALKTELAKMNIRAEDTQDTLKIFGGHPQAATIDTYNDHRMAMAFAVAGTRLPGMKINHPDVVTKTFPTFWEKLASL